MICVYEKCPIFEDSSYTLRLINNGDCSDLLKVYSDTKSVPLFNSDNCYGDDFHYTTEEQMANAIAFWIDKYEHKDFVRWSIVDNYTREVVGTIELFHRDANDYFTNCGLLRLDLRSDYEVHSKILKILSLILNTTFDLFCCNKIATKAIPDAVERIKALNQLGFKLADEKLIGHDDTEYENYYVLYKKHEIKLDCLSKSLTKTTFYGYLLKPVVFSSEILCIFLTKKVSSTKLYNSS